MTPPDIDIQRAAQHPIAAGLAGALIGLRWAPGATWLQRLTTTYPAAIWLNPVPEKYWGYTSSIQLVRQVMQDRMYPLTLAGLEAATKQLSRKH